MKEYLRVLNDMLKILFANKIVTVDHVRETTPFALIRPIDMNINIHVYDMSRGASRQMNKM